MNKSAIIDELNTHIAPQFRAIQDEGFYPRESLKRFGENGLYESFFVYGEGGILDAIIGIAEVSKVCINSGFCVWCQNALALYLHTTGNHALKERFFKKVSYGEILGGTGLSNPMKAYANLEQHRLTAKKTNGGYLINGVLPWVSNIDYGSIFAIVAVGEDCNVAGIVECDSTRLELSDRVRFVALNGTSTKSVTFKDYFLGDEFVLSAPVEGFFLAITPVFLMLQMGIALGCIDLSLRLINRSNVKHSDINKYLPLSEAKLQKERDRFLRRIGLLSENILRDSQFYLRSVLELRLLAGNLALKAAQSAIFHAGSGGYLEHSKEHKLLLESYFVALVTPSMRHLYKEINAIDEGGGIAKLWKENADNYQI